MKNKTKQAKKQPKPNTPKLFHSINGKPNHFPFSQMIAVFSFCPFLPGRSFRVDSIVFSKHSDASEPAVLICKKRWLKEFLLCFLCTTSFSHRAAPAPSLDSLLLVVLRPQGTELLPQQIKSGLLQMFAKKQPSLRPSPAATTQPLLLVACTGWRAEWG